MERYQEIEKSIITTYRKKIWSQFIKGIKEFDMVQEGDKIAVCMSGGKDSMLLAKCMQELKKHRKVNFEVVFLVMDPGYNDINRQKIISNAKLLNIPITIFNTNIYDTVAGVEDHPCYLCARMRRGALYRLAQDRGCNKIALGHHYDDVIETTLMNMLYSGSIQTMLPKLHSDNFKNMQLIRPLYFVREDDIISWAKNNKLQFLNCACKFTLENSIDSKNVSSRRLFTKKLIKDLSKDYDVDKNIFSATNNVILDKVLSYKKSGKIHSFLDNYDKVKN